MSQATILIVAASVAMLSFGCEDKSTPAAPSAAPTASQAAAVTAPKPSATAPVPTATASAAPHACPEGGAGEGTLAKPCDAKGKDRKMELSWTTKTDDKGPTFRVVNKSKTTILYGKIVAYFYDKAGKQLDVKDASGKTRPYQVCSGNVFGGVMKPAEKATLTFSCIEKANMPDGTTAIEAEAQIVGFASASDEKKVDYFWRNPDLTPDARPKGGVK